MSTMTTEAHDLFASNMESVIRTLLTHRGMKAVDAFPVLHMSKGTWHKRMHDGSWTAWELAQLADLLDVSVETFFEDPEELVRTRSFSTPELALIQGSGDGAPTEPTRTGRHLTPVH